LAYAPGDQYGLFSAAYLCIAAETTSDNSCSKNLLQAL
jgi:hypothetical protein